MEIEQNVWGFTDEGEAVVIYTMRNSSGSAVQLTNLGAAIVSLSVPDRHGNLADVVLGYEDFRSYMCDGAAMGKTVGRYANRIANGCFILDGVEYRLPQNSGPNHLHGGMNGFANRIWEGRVETNRVVFSLLSPDGDQGYPGELSVEVIYDWDDKNVLEITLLAKSSSATIVNLTNHAYFNLAGENSGTVLNHELQINADCYLPTDRKQIPTGEISSVEGTPMDFRRVKEIGKEINNPFPDLETANGYDNCWVINNYQRGVLAEAGFLYDPSSGRKMTFCTSQPGVQIYTGNFLQGGAKAKGGRYYNNRDGVAIECQGYPDAPNHPGFPSQRLAEDEIYEEHIVYKFSTE